MNLTVNPLTHVIYIEKNDLTLIQSIPTEIRELGLNDFRMSLKSWEDSEEGIYQLKTHNHFTEVNVGGLTLARVIDILPPYTITFEDLQYAVNLTGANSNVGDRVNVNQVSVRSFNSAGMTSSPAIEYSSFNGGVTVDVVNGSSGTIYNVGTPENPVNNLTDAILIADYRGFDTLFINKSMIIDNGSNIENFTIIGRSKVHTELYIHPDTMCTGLDIENCTVSGTLDGNSILRDCYVGDLNYVNGQILDSGLYGLIMLGGNKEAILNNCYTVDQDHPAVIDMGGSGQDLSVPNYSGMLSIKNLTSASEEIGVGLNAGMITLEDTISAGTIIISGVGLLQNNTTGTANVNTDGLMSKGTIVESVEEAIGAEVQYASYNGGVTVDVVTGVSGTAYNIGTPVNPVNNLTDAILIANERGFDTLYINSSMTIDSGSDIENFTIIGQSKVHTELYIHPDTMCTGLDIENCTVSGVLDGNTIIKDCYVGDLNYVNGQISNSGLYGTIVLDGNKEATFNNCYLVDQDNYPVIDMGGSGQDLLVLNYAGAITIKNLTSDTEEIGVGISAGIVILDETVSAGTIVITGVGVLEDHSTGTADVDTDGLVSKGTIVESVEEAIGAEIQYASFAGGVTVDIITGVSGTAYNIGTSSNPVNNLMDAVSIANERGFDTLYINSSMELDHGNNLENFTIIGKSRVDTMVHVHSNLVSEGLEVVHCNVSGTLDGDTIIKDCYIGDLSYVNGQILGSGLYGVITLGGSKTVVINDCNFIQHDKIPTIDMGGSGQDLLLGNFSGLITIRNLHSDTEGMSIGLNAGVVTLDETITAGSIIISGIGLLEDNSTGTADVNTEGLVSKATIAESVENAIGDEVQYASFNGGVTIDVVAGVSGTLYNIGTSANPVNNVTDAVTIAEERGFSKLYVNGDITFSTGDDLDGFTICGESTVKSKFVIGDGASTENCGFFDATISGVLDGNAVLERCVVGDINYITGRMFTCALTGTIILTGANPVRVLSCYDGIPGVVNPIIDCGGSGRGLAVGDWSGGLEIINKTGAEEVAINMSAGRIIIHDTVTNGDIFVRGIGTLEDNSTGSAEVESIIVSPESISDAVWEEQIADHTTVSGSTAELMDKIKKLVNLIPVGL